MFPLRDTVRSNHPAVAVWLLILCNALVFFFELRLQPDDLEQVLYLFGLVPARYTHPRWAMMMGFPLDDYWPFFTSIFLHGGWLHIILNMWTLWIFGDNVEDRMGTWRFLLFYTACGIMSLMVHAYFNPSSRVPAIGASGAIAGVLGAYLLMYPRAMILTVIPIFFYPFFIRIPAYFYLGFWFLMQLGSVAMASTHAEVSGGVAFWAHVGGFICGMLIWPLFLHPHRRRQPAMAEASAV